MAQSLSCVLIHFVFSTKNRRPIISAAFEQDLFPYFATVLRGMNSPSIAINGVEDHIHALFSLARTVTIADVVEEVKKRSSKMAKANPNGVADFQWQNGYGAFSIGGSQVPDVTRYIAGQKAHHQKMSYQDEFRALCRKYGVEWDEQYVRD